MSDRIDECLERLVRIERILAVLVEEKRELVRMLRTIQEQTDALLESIGIITQQDLIERARAKRKKECQALAQAPHQRKLN
jgi:hypothetical protein